MNERHSLKVSRLQLGIIIEAPGSSSTVVHSTSNVPKMES